MEKLVKQVEKTIERMLVEYGVNNIYPVLINRVYKLGLNGEIGEFRHFNIIPVNLADVIEKIEEIDDMACDTTDGIDTLFGYEVTINDLLTMTNKEIMDEIVTMLEAYKESILLHVVSYPINAVQKLKFDYDKGTELYTYTVDGSVMMCTENFMPISNKKYTHGFVGRRGRWYRSN